MAQTKAVQDQPSMEDILTSIRRIIDEGEAKSPNTSPPSKDEVANDDLAVATSPSENSDSQAAQEVAQVAINEIPELDSFLEALDAKYTAQQGTAKKTPDAADATKIASTSAPAEDASSPEIDASIAIIDEAMGVVEDEGKGGSKYDARFSDDDRDAFKAVGSALAANTAEQSAAGRTAAPEMAQSPASTQSSTALVSEPTRARVGGSLNDLSETLAKEAKRQLPEMTEAMLKPMLSDWLDNNLPSLVERLVREEIERIARGD